MNPFVRLTLFLVLIGAISLICPFGTMPTTVTPPPSPFPTQPLPLPLPPSTQPPQPTPQDTPTSEPTTPPEPTPTLEPQAFFTEDFNTPADFWSYFIVNGNMESNQIIEGDLGQNSVESRDGHLVFEINQNWQYVYAVYAPHTYTDVQIDVRAENLGVNNNNISLICRYGERGWYEFNIANNGLYSILYARMRPSKKITYVLLANGGSKNINMGKDINEYTAICKGRTLQLFINGVKIKTIENRVLREGKAGISVSSFNVLPVQVQFDWVRFSQP